MKILTEWLREYLPGIPVDDHKLAEDLTLRGIAVDGSFDLGAGKGLLLEMDITTNRVDAMNHYGIAREASAIYGLPLPALDVTLPEARAAAQPYPVSIDAPDLCGRFTARGARAEADFKCRRCHELRLDRHGAAHACLRSRQAARRYRRPSRL
jgi:phenylalanyl-tRNA synthetase beta chain